MTYLITEIILCLIAAAALGLLTGWLLWRDRGSADTRAYSVQREIDRERIRDLENQLAARDAVASAPPLAHDPPPVTAPPEAPELPPHEESLPSSPPSEAPHAEAMEQEQPATPLAPEVYQTQAPLSDLSSVPYEDDFAVDDPFADDFSDEDIAAATFEETEDGPTEATFADDAPLTPSPLPPAPLPGPPEAERTAAPAYDDLKRISGIGPAIESQLAEIGVTTYRQIARFTDDDIERVGAHIDFFADRIRREGWVVQAAALHRQTYGGTP